MGSSLGQSEHNFCKVSPGAPGFQEEAKGVGESANRERGQGIMEDRVGRSRGHRGGSCGEKGLCSPVKARGV